MQFVLINIKPLKTLTRGKKKNTKCCKKKQLKYENQVNKNGKTGRKKFIWLSSFLKIGASKTIHCTADFIVALQFYKQMKLFFSLHNRKT